MKNWKVLKGAVRSLDFRFQKYQEEIADSRVVQALCKQEDLLSEDFSSTASATVGLHSKIEKQISFLSAFEEYLSRKTSRRRMELIGSIQHLFSRNLDVPPDMKKQGSVESNVEAMARNQLVLISEEIEKDSSGLMDAAEPMTCEGATIDLITSTKNLFKCDCGNLFYAKLPENGKCGLCKTNLSLKNCLKIPLTVLEDRVYKFLSENIWLEEGVARLYRKVQMRTIVRPNIMGTSGVAHEIDVLSYDKQKLVLIECSISDIKLKTVYRGYCKKVDVGSHMLHIFSVGDLEPDAEKFARAHGIQLFPNVISETTETENKLADLLSY